jgi:hypothetical protein
VRDWHLQRKIISKRRAINAHGKSDKRHHAKTQMKMVKSFFVEKCAGGCGASGVTGGGIRSRDWARKKSQNVVL